MQERDYSGRERLVDFDKFLDRYGTSDPLEALEAAKKRMDVAEAELRNPGDIAEVGGRKYQVQESGAWKRIS